MSWWNVTPNKAGEAAQGTFAEQRDEKPPKEKPPAPKKDGQ